MALYRGQTSTIDQIQATARMRITTIYEAVTFLRALPALLAQVTEVLQRASIAVSQKNNRELNQVQPEPTPEPEPAPTPEPEKPFQPEEFDSEEGYSDKEKTEKVAKLKKASKKTKE